MTYSSWDTGDYPILINPDFSEICKLGMWDTIRICIDGENIGLASGHGNTHDSITKMMIAHRFSRGLPKCYILFRENSQYWFNLEDLIGLTKVRVDPVLRKYFSQEHGNTIRDVIAERESH